MLTVLIVIHLMLVLAMVGVVLLQKSEGGGLVSSTSGFLTGRGTALSLLAGLGRKPTSIINPGAPATQEAPAGSPTAPLSRSGRGVLDQLQGGAPANAPAAPSGPQVPQSK